MRDKTENQPRWPSRDNLTTISFVAFLAGAVGMGSGAIRIAEAFGEQVDVTLASNTQVASDAAEGAASILHGSYPTAQVTVTDLSIGPRLLLAGGILGTVLMVVAVAAAVMYLCFRLGQGRPFVASLTRALSLSAWALILGGILTQVLTGFGDWLAAAELNPDPPLSGFPFVAHFDAWTLVAGIVLRLIVAAFRIGDRVQRDAELARFESQRLRRQDLDGLV